MAVELSEFGIKYEPHSSGKAQVLADFIAEMTPEPTPLDEGMLTLHVDGCSNGKGSGAGIILENKDGTTIEVSLAFSFPISNNQAEYKACVAGLLLALEFGVKKVEIRSDSLLAVSQINDVFSAKDESNYVLREIHEGIGGASPCHYSSASYQMSRITF